MYQVRQQGESVQPGLVLCVHMPQRAPDGAIALEARPERDLPHAVASLHALLCLDRRQHVPAQGTGVSRLLFDNTRTKPGLLGILLAETEENTWLRAFTNKQQCLAVTARKYSLIF